MRAYRERLVVPASWWLWATCCVLLLGSLVWAGFAAEVGLAVYAVLEAGCAAILIAWGAAVIEVSGAQLRAGSRRLPLGEVGEVAALDAEQTAALRGPRADPSAYLIVRPYLPRSVYIEIAGQPGGQPYWLIGTRHPERLAEALGRARARSAAPAACDDSPGEGTAVSGPAAGAPAASGEDGNAW